MVIAARDTEIKPGYKLTEAGVVPEDWEVKSLSNLVIFSGGSQPPRSTFKFKMEDEYIRLIQIRDYKTDEFETYIPKEFARKKCTANDIMIGRYGPPIFQILRGIEGAYNVALLKVIPSSRIDREYLYQFLRQDSLFYYIESLSQRSSGQTGIEMPALKNYPFPLPPLSEQRAIATALSDVDDLITSLDKLIAKKRDIKQATMQQLLTGKSRLPGFSQNSKQAYKQTEMGMIPVDWEVRTLDDEIDQLQAGVSVNSVDEEFHIYAHEQAVLKTSAVSNGYFFPHEKKIIASRDIKRARLNPHANSIIISRMNTPDLVGECGYIDKDYPDLFLPDRLWMMRFKRGSKINVQWLSYLLSYKEYRAKIKGAATGTSGSMKNISKSSLLSINIPFPLPEEQQAIATVLSDMDTEIVALEQKRDKTRELKQGMMQELLTGKTRLL